MVQDQALACGDARVWITIKRGREKPVTYIAAGGAVRGELNLASGGASEVSEVSDLHPYLCFFPSPADPPIEYMYLILLISVLFYSILSILLSTSFSDRHQASGMSLFQEATFQNLLTMTQYLLWPIVSTNYK